MLRIVHSHWRKLRLMLRLVRRWLLRMWLGLRRLLLDNGLLHGLHHRLWMGRDGVAH